MNLGRFAHLQVEHPMVEAIQGGPTPIGYTSYYLSSDEVDAVDDANRIFTEMNRQDLLIHDYDIIGWALDHNTFAEDSREPASDRRRRQNACLVWVTQSRFGDIGHGRISGTLLELIVLAKSTGRLWNRKYGTTRAHGKANPFGRTEFSGSFEQLILSNESVSFTSILPKGILDRIAGKESSSGEYVDRDILTTLGLLNEKSAATRFAIALVNAIERWWICERLIADPSDVESLARHVPLEVTLYVVGETHTKIALSELAEWTGFGADRLLEAIDSALSKHSALRVQFGMDEKTIEATDRGRGIELCTYNDLLRRLANRPLWTHYLSGAAERSSLLPLRSKLLGDLQSKIASAARGVWILTAPRGWGRTGSLLRIGREIEKRGIPIALYRGGAMQTRLPHQTVVVCDDVERLGIASIRQLSLLAEDGYRIVGTLSQEAEMLFTEAIGRLRLEGTNLEYTVVRLPPLPDEDAVVQVRAMFPNLKEKDEIGRIVKKAQSLHNAPDLIAWLSLQANALPIVRAADLEVHFYILSRIPAILFGVLHGFSGIDIESELAALAIMHVLDSEIRVADQRVISEMAAEMAGSGEKPRYFTSVLELSDPGSAPRMRLGIGARLLFELCRNEEYATRVLLDLHEGGLITRAELQWAITLVGKIRSTLRSCVNVTETYVGRILEKADKREFLYLLPYVVRVARNRPSLAEILQKHYSWLEALDQIELLRLHVTPAELGEILASLAFVVSNLSSGAIDSFRASVLDAFRRMWQRGAVIPVDHFNGPYLELLGAVSRRLMETERLDDAISLLQEGIQLADDMHFLTQQVSLLCDKAQALRTLSPAFCSEVARVLDQAASVTEKLETVDVRETMAVVKNQRSLALLACGHIDEAEQSAHEALDFALACISAPEVTQTQTPLELAKSAGWAYYELAQCDFARGDYSQARACIREAREYFVETRHQHMLDVLDAFEPIVYLREGKIPEADRLSFRITQLFPENHQWLLSGNALVYAYYLAEPMPPERLVDLMHLDAKRKEYSRILQEAVVSDGWFTLPVEMQVLRRTERVGQAIEAGLKFLDMCCRSRPGVMPLVHQRISVSLVLRELGIAYNSVAEYSQAAQALFGAAILWTSVLGQRKEFATTMLRKCMEASGLSQVMLGGWSATVTEAGDDVEIRLVNEERAIRDHRNGLWSGVSEILKEEPSG